MIDRNDAVEINIQNLLSNEDEYIEQIEIQTKSRKFKIPLHLFIKYSQIHQNNDIITNIIDGISHKIIEQEKRGKLKEKNITLFFQILQEENVFITSDEIWELLRLSKIFKIGVLEKYIEKYANNHSNDIDFLINLKIEYETVQTQIQQTDNEIYEYDEIDEEINSMNKMNENLEKQMRDKIDDCLKRENFGKLSISTIYRIIESCTEKINKDELYEFIRKSYETRFPLLQFIHIHQLTEKKFDELFNDYSNMSASMKKKFEEYMPVDIIYIKRSKDVEREQRKRIEELEEKMKELREQNEELNIESNKYRAQNESLNEKLKQIEIQNEELMQSNDKYQAQIKQIEVQNEELKQSNNKYQAQIKIIK